ncbi:MAG: Branched-chain amino acid transporter, amino acid-binding protein [Myxococcaceae bacterium]|nr:Branched-chain amino acid transporter, amino acid-binding protein [Myxococcaceae bacterium]
MARRLRLVLLTSSALLGGVSGCNALLSLGDFSVVPASVDASDEQTLSDVIQPDADDGGFVGECTTNVECTDRATAAEIERRKNLPDAGDDAGDAGVDPDATVALDGGTGIVVPAVCVRPQQKCVTLTSVDCKTITGDYKNPNAIVIGSLFTTSGAQGGTNIARQQSATLAVEEINASQNGGGIPGATATSPARPLVMVSCDETARDRAAGHLVNDLHVPAIVGPNLSQDVLDLTTNLTAKAGTLMITPTSVASPIADLADNDLTWRLVPSDTQRAALMIAQLNQMESDIRAALPGQPTPRPVRMAIIYRNDALGQGSFNALSSIVFNGAALSAPINANAVNGAVRIKAYSPTAPEAAIASEIAGFAPDIVALFGTAESITKEMTPLEANLAADGGVTKPQYMLIDSNKVKEVTDLVTARNAVDPGLRTRIRGTGLISEGTSAQVFTQFNLAYAQRYGAPAAVSSMGPSYDATYAIAYALASKRDQPVTGATVAAGFRKLSGGATVINIGSQKILAAYQALTAGDNIQAVGTFGALEWDAKGDFFGTIEMWCVGTGSNFGSSGLLFNVKSQTPSGTYTQCP